MRPKPFIRFIAYFSFALFCSCQRGGSSSGGTASSTQITSPGKPVDADIIMGLITGTQFYGVADAGRIPAVNVSNEGKALRLEIVPGATSPVRIVEEISQFAFNVDKKFLFVPGENQIYAQETGIALKAVATGKASLPDSKIEAFCLTKNESPAREIRIYQSSSGYELYSVDSNGVQPWPEAGLTYLKSETDLAVTYTGGVISSLQIRKTETELNDSSYFASTIQVAGVGGTIWNPVGIVCHGNFPQAIDVSKINGVAQKTFKGPKGPGVVVSDNSNGGSGTWVSPSYAMFQDSTYALVNGQHQLTSEYLRATDFYGMEPIPKRSTINGIKVEVVARKGGQSGGAFAGQKQVRIVKGGTIGSLNKGDNTNLTSAFQTLNYGSDTDLWGETWTAEDINAAGFGVALAYEFITNTTFVQIDQIRITVSYTPTLDKTLTMASANRAVSWNIGSTKTLSWSTTGEISKVNLLYSPDEGASFPVKIASNIFNTGSFNWLINQLPSPTGKIKIEDADNLNNYDINQADITLPPASVNVTSPNGGTGYIKGATQTVTWSSTNLGGNVDILLSLDGGTTYGALALQTPNDGSEAIVWPAMYSQNARLRIRSSALHSLFDESDTYFALVPAFTGAIGPVSASSIVNDTTIGATPGGWAPAPWTNPMNAIGFDTLYAAMNGSGFPSNYLKSMGYFINSSIPADAVITGLLFEVNGYSQGECNAFEAVISVTKNGLFGVNNKSTGAQVPIVNSSNYVSYGGSTDLWGETWTVGEIKDSSFGFGFSIKKGVSCGYNLNHVRATVYFAQ